MRPKQAPVSRLNKLTGRRGVRINASVAAGSDQTEANGCPWLRLRWGVGGRRRPGSHPRREPRASPRRRRIIIGSPRGRQIVVAHRRQRHANPDRRQSVRIPASTVGASRSAPYGRPCTAPARLAVRVASNVSAGGVVPHCRAKYSQTSELGSWGPSRTPTTTGSALDGRWFRTTLPFGRGIGPSIAE